MVKIELATLSRVDAVTLNPGEDGLLWVIDPTGTYGYFGASTEVEEESIPGRVVQIDLTTMTRVDAITLDPGEDRLWSGVTAPDGEYCYFGTFMNPARVVRVRLAETEPEDSAAS